MKSGRLNSGGSGVKVGDNRNILCQTGGSAVRDSGPGRRGRPKSRKLRMTLLCSVEGDKNGEGYILWRTKEPKLTCLTVKLERARCWMAGNAGGGCDGIKSSFPISPSGMQFHVSLSLSRSHSLFMIYSNWIPDYSSQFPYNRRSKCSKLY